MLVLGPVEHVAATGVVGVTNVDEQVAAVLRHEGGGLGVVKAAINTPLACTARISGSDGWIDLPAFMHCPTSFTVNAVGSAPEVSTRRSTATASSSRSARCTAASTRA